jgi:hypothetical protein
MKHALFKLEEANRLFGAGRAIAPRERTGTVETNPRVMLTCALAAAIALAVWCGFLWTAARPTEIAADWHGWRQTDTQTIAQNLTRPGARILWPQINWGGDGPGYVETELQLFPKLISLLMRIAGPAEWPGQLISLLAIAAAGAVVFFHGSQRYGGVAALAGLGAFLAARTSPHLATVVMPDALALLAYVTAWTFFYRYARAGRTADLIVYGVAGTLAMLTKPTTAHIGISSVVLLALAARPRLREVRVWVTWTVMVIVFAAYLVHAHQLYTEYGNTFGLLVGEDSKTPKLRYLLMPHLFVNAARFTVNWGLGPLAAAALVVQALRRRFDAEHVALAAGNAIIVVVALRYMSDFAGTYYSAPCSLLGATVIAATAHELTNVRRRYVLFGVLTALLLVQGYRNVNLRKYNVWYFSTEPVVSGVVQTGKEIDRLTGPGDLIVVRSPNTAYDTFWQQAANYHDPRIFYISGTRGWTLGREQEDPSLLAAAAGRGARYFADPVGDRPVALDAWLTKHGKLVWSMPGGAGRIWKLQPADLR